MSNHHIKGIEEFVETKVSEIDYNQYKNELTFVPFEIAITMKESSRDCEVNRYIGDDIDHEEYIISEYT